jgi:redox-sensitive bicupin YhaK (pirin superfamily)
VVGVVLLTIGVSVSLIAISEGQLSLSARRNETVLNVTEACAEDALLQLNTTNTLPASVVLPEGTCSVVTDSHVGTTWVFTVTGVLETLTKNVQITADRINTVSVTSWLEVL